MLGIGLAQHLVRRPRNSPLRFGAIALEQQRLNILLGDFTEKFI